MCFFSFAAALVLNFYGLDLIIAHVLNLEGGGCGGDVN